MAEISSQYRLPGAIICPDITGNTVPRDCCPAVIIAASNGGSATDYTLNRVASAAVAAELFGAGSPAHEAASYYLNANPFGELIVVPYAPTGAAATGSIALAGTATENGEIAVFVNCAFFTVDVLVGDTAADISAAIVAAMASVTLPLAGVDAAGTVNLTAAFGGAVSNQIQIDVTNIPDGITATVTDMAGGAGTATLATALDALGQCCCYDFVAITENDDLSMNALEAWFDERWGCECFVGGRYYNTIRGNFTEVTTYLDNRNDRFASTMVICEDECVADYQKLGAFIGAAHLKRCTDVSKSWYKQELTGVPNMGGTNCGESCFTSAERNIIANLGGTTSIDGSGAFQIIESDTGLGILTDAGENDTFLAYPQAAYQTMDVARLFKVFVDDSYDDVVVVENGTFVRQGSDRVTPNMIIAEIKAFFRGLEGSIIENVDDIDEFITVEIDPTNPSRVDACVRFDLVSALRTFAVKLSPRISLGVN